MKLTEQQQQEVKATLWPRIMFSDTYDEVFDHVVTSLQNETGSEQTIPRRVEQVIETDFGGFVQLKQTEWKRAKIVGSVIQKQRRIAVAYLKFPNIIYLALFVAAVLYLGSIKLLIFLSVIASFSLLIPMLIFGFSTLQRALKKQKPSVTDVSFGYIAFFSLVFYFISKPWHQLNDLDIDMPRHYMVPLLILTICFALFGLSFIKLYRNSFKVKIAN